MHVVWRRPDGFHGAAPQDFRVLELGGHSRIWLHKSDTEWFPFRISGGWQDDDATKKLNTLVNLLNKPSAEWLSHLIRIFHNSMADDPQTFMTDLETWLGSLKDTIKADKWEAEIMVQAI